MGMPKVPKEKPDCLTCGVCCVSAHDNPIWAEVLLADCKRLGPSWCRRNVLGYNTMDLLTRVLDHGPAFMGGIKTRWRKLAAGPFKGVEVCACVALKGNIMHKVECSVYKHRPKVCRNALRPGERQCHEARRMFKDAAEDAL